MNTRVMNQPVRPSVLAVRAALAALSGLAMVGAHAADATVQDLTQPINTVEVGVGTTIDPTAKSAEYNGLRNPGAFFVGNVDLRSTTNYDSGDAFRWRLTGRDLGTESRSVKAEVGVQGTYRLDLLYSTLQHNTSDSYQTPYNGVGTNTFTLPATWMVPVVPRLSGTSPNARGLSPAVTSSNGLVAGVPTAPTAAQLATASTLQNADLPSFRSAYLSTERTQYGLGVTYEIDRHWQVKASAVSETKAGLQQLNVLTAFTGGDISTSMASLIDQKTDQFNASLAYVGEKLTLNAAYYGSYFTNNVNKLSWNNWAAPANVQTMSTAPSNEFNQLNLTGTYALSPTMKLVGNLSYGRNTQDDPFLTDISTPLVPVSSLHGLVVSEAANFKLLARPNKDLALSAAYKFDEHDNRTPVNTYGFYDAGALASGTSPFAAYFPGLGSNANINANRPYSKRINQLNLDADYAVTHGQALKVGLELQDIDRYCSGTWIDCVDASKVKETTARAEWRLNSIEDFSARVGLSGARRTVNYNEDAFLALVPAANLVPTGSPGGATAYGTLTALGLTGYGPILGLNPQPAAGSAAAFFFGANNALANADYGNVNRISELPGMRRFDMANRDRGALRSSLNWHANDAWTLGAGLDLNDDHYGDSVYGLQSARSSALNLDAAFSASEDLNLTLFYTHEDQHSVSAGNSYTANSTAANVSGFTAISGGCFATIALRNASNKIDPCLNWGSDTHDKVDTIGLSGTRKNLVGGKLDLSGGLNFSRARTDETVTGGNYVNNPLAVAGAPAGTIAAYYVPAAAMPTVVTDTTELKVNARYALAKQQAVHLGFSWQHMSSTNWSYDGMQYGGLSGVLPTNQVSPNFNVFTFAVAYVFQFR